MAAAALVAGLGAMGAEEEARAVAASTIAQILTKLRVLITYILEYVRMIVKWVGENPEYALMFFVNLYILFT